MSKNIREVIVDKVSLVTKDKSPAVEKAETRFALFKFANIRKAFDEVIEGIVKHLNEVAEGMQKQSNEGMKKEATNYLLESIHAKLSKVASDIEKQHATK